MQQNIKLLAFINFFTDLKFYAPVAILYFTQVSGSFALGMSIFAVVQIAAAGFEIPTGVFSDRIGRRNTLILGAIASAFAVTCYAIGGGYAFLFVGAIAEGLSRSFFSGNNEALLHDSLTEIGKREQYHRFLGKTNSLFGIAGAISALVGGLLAFISFSLVMWISVIPQLVLLGISLRVREPKIRVIVDGNIYQHLKESIVAFMKNHHLRNFSITTSVAYAIGEAGYVFSAAFFAMLWPLWAIGLARFLSNVGSSASSYFSGRVIDRISSLRIFVGTLVYCRIVNFIALFFPTVFSPLLMTTTSLTHGLTTTARTNLLHKEFTDHQRATMGSINSLIGSIMYAFFALIVGVLGDRFGAVNALIIIQFFYFAVIVSYYFIFRYHKS